MDPFSEPRPTRIAVMTAGPTSLAHYLRRLALARASEGATDTALLGRFLSERDEAAFAALVSRYGPLVLRVCRRVLGDAHDAEDAFQATFLVLARKAATVQPPEALAAWLHGVAQRVALKARSARAHQRGRAPLLTLPPANAPCDPLADLSARDLLALVDEEVRRLPEVYRLPVILCCLEGRSLEEAARQLGWTPGSVKGRLERGRARLHDRLVRRGLTLSAALAAVEVSRRAASAAGLAGLLLPTVRAALAFTAPSLSGPGGISPRAAAWAANVATSTALPRLRIAATLVLAASLLSAGYLLSGPSPATPSPQAPSSLPSGKAASGTKDWPRTPEDDAPIEVSGRVLDPEGKPFEGARLYVGYALRRFASDPPFPPAGAPLRAVSGPDGRFHLTFARSELDARWLDDSQPAVIAVARGYGPEWSEIGDNCAVTGLTLRLGNDLAVNGRILDPDRRPVPGARLQVCEIQRYSAEALTRLLRGVGPVPPGGAWKGPLPGQAPSVTTTSDGRFRLSGVGRDRVVTLAVEAPGIPRTLLSVATRDSSPTPPSWQLHLATFEYVVPISRPLRGVVRDRGTGKPVPGVKVSVQNTGSTTQTDERGRYDILIPPQSVGWIVMAEPDHGQPYFAASARLGPGLDALTADFELVGGIRLTGRVTDQGTHKPPPTAVVEYHPLFPNPHSARLTNAFNMAASSAVMQPDGTYRLVVLPGPGVVCVAASPRDAYAVASIDDEPLARLLPDGINPNRGHNPRTAVGANDWGTVHVIKYHALALINPPEREQSLSLDLTVQTGRRLRGTVVAPDGKPLTGVRVTGLTALPDHELLSSASFTVRGLNPRCTRELCFYHRDKALGRIVTVRGDETRPLTVRLDPCGSVRGRLVDKNGKPVSGITVSFLRRQNWFDAFETDREGRFRAALVSGAKFSLGLASLRPLLRDVGEVEVNSGRSRDLGDLPVGDSEPGGAEEIAAATNEQSRR
jgi:RNA polymerase sigma factor (sigma-70 family)